MSAMQIDAQEVINELSERIRQQEVEMATQRVVIRSLQSQLAVAQEKAQRPVPTINEEELNRP